jgi:ligand-binding sensor domain-containing protein
VLSHVKNFRWVALPTLASALVVLSAGIVGAERRPIKLYTTTDGLPRNGINRIVRDSHGFLWFCTQEGLSRFDGYVFTNYGIEQGLPDRDVTDLIETRAGEYWVATHNGIARLNPKVRETESKFVTYATNWNLDARHVMALVEDRNGTIWGGTAGGLCQLEKVEGRWQLRVVNLDGHDGAARPASVETLLEDSKGALWIGASEGLYRRSPNGSVEKYTSANGLPRSGTPIGALLEDIDGRLWIGTNAGLFLLSREPDPREPVVARAFTSAQGLRSSWIESLHRSLDGKILVGTVSGLAELSDARTAEGRSLQGSSTVAAEIRAIAEDVRGNLWMGTSYGAMKLARNGFTTYSSDDGLGKDAVAAVLEDRVGQLGVINKVHGMITITDSTAPASTPRGSTCRRQSRRPEGAGIRSGSRIRTGDGGWALVRGCCVILAWLASSNLRTRSRSPSTPPRMASWQTTSSGPMKTCAGTCGCLARADSRAGTA